MGTEPTRYQTFLATLREALDAAEQLPPGYHRDNLVARVRDLLAAAEVAAKRAEQRRG